MTRHGPNLTRWKLFSTLTSTGKSLKQSSPSKSSHSNRHAAESLFRWICAVRLMATKVYAQTLSASVRGSKERWSQEYTGTHYAHHPWRPARYRKDDHGARTCPPARCSSCAYRFYRGGDFGFRGTQLTNQ